MLSSARFKDEAEQRENEWDGNVRPYCPGMAIGGGMIGAATDRPVIGNMQEPTQPSTERKDLQASKTRHSGDPTSPLPRCGWHCLPART